MLLGVGLMLLVAAVFWRAESGLLVATVIGVTVMVMVLRGFWSKF